MKRREFLKTSAAGLGMATILNNPASVNATPVNNRVNLALIGCGSISGLHRQQFIQHRKEDDVRFLYAVDVQQSRAERAAKEVSKPDQPTQAVQEMKVALDDKNVDGVIIATPDHWHALATIRACQAGKDVYVEKPVARTPFEGEQMVNAAKKYHRIVQVGTQTRSAEYVMNARKYIEEGHLGRIEFCRIHNMWPVQGPDSVPTAPIPEDLLWDVWLGPAKYREFSPLYMRGLQWEWFWDLGIGILGVQGIHQIDMARWVLGLKYPKTAYSVGILNAPPGGRETPDTQSTVFEFGNMVVNLEQTLGKPYMLETDGEVRNGDMFPYWYQNATRVEIYGQKALMVIGRLGAGWQVFIRTKDRKPVTIAQEYGRYTMYHHLFDYVESIRSRKTPNCPVEEGQVSTMLVHYANISYRAGGVKLEIDQETGKITNCPETAKFWRPEFRQPYDIPEIG
ncbi:MAG: Gfo/Idh/MocA family oxidoreductase [Planctomycetia bacterium]|nr:Gfo/Idh/MocA family oxidoreductase [Planctomycetia bacterium]